MLMKSGAARHDDRPNSTAWPKSGFARLGGIPTFKGYNGFTGSICASVNDEVVHGIPGTRVLNDGDLLSIDIGTTLDGYVSDTRRDGRRSATISAPRRSACST